jgi:hypothetical protein
MSRNRRDVKVDEVDCSAYYARLEFACDDMPVSG